MSINIAFIKLTKFYPEVSSTMQIDNTWWTQDPKYISPLSVELVGNDE